MGDCLSCGYHLKAWYVKPDEGLRWEDSLWIDFSCTSPSLIITGLPASVAFILDDPDLGFHHPACCFQAPLGFHHLALAKTSRLLATARGPLRFNAPATGRRVYHYSHHWSTPAGCNPVYEEGHRSVFLSVARSVIATSTLRGSGS